MVSKKMKKKCKNAYLDLSNLKNKLRGKRIAFYTKKERKNGIIRYAVPQE